MSSKDVRQHIIDTAALIISQKGFSAVGINELLKAAQVPKGSFYHYFRSKEAFGVALLDNYFKQYLAYLSELLNREDLLPEQALMEYWHHWQTTQSCDSCAHRCLVVKLAAEVSDLSESMRQVLQRGMAQIIEQIAQIIEQIPSKVQLAGQPSAHELAQRLYQLWLGASLQAKVYRDDSALALAMKTTRSWLNV